MLLMPWQYQCYQYLGNMAITVYLPKEKRVSKLYKVAYKAIYIDYYLST